MLFNSLDFALFFPLVFLCYWFVFNKNLRVQNAFLLLASYFFYACWDWRFLFLLAFSTLVNYYFGLAIARNELKKRKLLLIAGIIINAGLLGYFKYFNFFVESFADIFSIFGYRFNFTALHILLPLGISFYTFQNISYITDVYRRQSLAQENLLSFSLFIAFFPQLISGPIARENQLMPQINRLRVFNYTLAVNGMRMILLGLFEKMVIADNCAIIVNRVYGDFEAHSGSTLFFSAVVYSFQIYGDFSGYSHLAIGSAALLGIQLRDNFNYPYLAKNIADFWRRWHISFSGWLRDYIYFPLGGSKRGNLIQIRNLAIVFIFSGIWHGANWTFVVYGCIHAFLYILYVYYRKFFGSEKETVLGNCIAIFSTFTVLTLARVFFRAQSVPEALTYLRLICNSSLFTKPDMSRLMLVLLLLYVGLEWLQRDKRHLLDISFIKSVWIRYLIYLAVAFSVFYFAGESGSFVYFKF